MARVRAAFPDFHVKTGLITRGVVIADTWGLLQQLGAVSPIESISQRP